MPRPSITLTLIAKNEAKNVPVLFQSIHGCFDHIVFVDTGSTDETVAVANEWANKIGTPISIHHFEWVKDFSKARNFALDQVKTQYAMWLDLDDSLGNPEAFIKWRDTAMEFADYWLATYNYALDENKKPIIKFIRERVFKMSMEPRFRYFIHEGVTPNKPNIRANVINTWWVDHRRTMEEMKQDKGRNLDIIESKKAELDGRLWFYYGKELYENGRIEEALRALLEGCTRPDIELHDRVLCFQYACYASMALADKKKEEHQAEDLVRAINLAHQGLQLDPKRAEFHHLIGECYIKQKRLVDAAPFFAACKECKTPNPTGSSHSAPIFSFKQIYEEMPRINLAKIYFNFGDIDKAEKEINECLELYPTQEVKNLKEELAKIKPLVQLNSGVKEKTNDIVITCPPQGAYEFDSELYKTKGMGGSETACIEMATWIRKLTGLPIKVFNMRAKDLIDENGIEWISTNKLNDYFSKIEPKVNIAWRHNVKLTNAPTYLWCHDLVTPGVDIVQNFDKMFCLSEFHKSYVMAMQGVTEDKIIVTRNGINVEKFKFVPNQKNTNKIVWMSSPDRGLDRAMKVIDLLKADFPNLELHVYYGLENLYKYGLAEMAERLKAMMQTRPWVKYHGFTEQSKMYQDVSDAAIWLHPCDFIETFCITALEMLSLGIYPVTRRLGALQNTLAIPEKEGMATMLDHDCITDWEFQQYAKATREALLGKKWQNVSVDFNKFAWENVAKEWVKILEL